MWIMLNDAMFSIVENRDDETGFVVRARRKGDLEKVFTSYSDRVIEQNDSDYRFRIFADKEDVIETMSDEFRRINYDNFKNSVTDSVLKMAYQKVWSIFFDVQLRAYPDHNGWITQYYRKREDRRKKNQEYYDQLMSED